MNFRTTTGPKFQNVESVFLVDQNIDDIDKDQNVGHWCTIVVPSFLADFEIIPIEAAEARFFGGWERGSPPPVR